MTEKTTLNKTIEESIDIAVPATTAYNQWTQFEDYPKLLRGLEEVRQLDDRRVRWKLDVQGRPVEWEAEIVEQIPDKRIAWRSTSGEQHAGVVTFHRIEDDRCRVMLQMDYHPEGVGEKAADFLGLVRREVRARLEDMQRALEARGAETGAWRGEIPSKDDVQKEGGAS